MHFIGIALFFLPLTVFANVIFPAFSGAYVTQVFFPLLIAAALLTESVVFKTLNREVKLLPVLGLVVGANLISSIVGIFLTSFLPSGLIKGENGILTSGPDFNLYFTCSFLVACLLSILIEGMVYRYFKTRFSILHPYKASVVGNIVSYLVIYFLNMWFK
jgi:hypothetical protein